jgi:hypothetical protein
MKTALFAASTIAVLFFVQRARAAEPEAVRFEVVAPEGCVDEAELRSEVAALGATFRDANLDDHARAFRIEVTKSAAHVKGRLVVRDLVFRERVREVDASSCGEVTKTLALFIATALDDAPVRPDVAPAPVSAPLAPWPAPAADRSATLEGAPRLGSGGVLVNGFVGGGSGTAVGARAAAVVRATGTTRVGIAGTMTSDERWDSNARAFERVHGIATRVGMLVGWGAPWNDGIVGFSAEAGVSLTSLRGDASPRVCLKDTLSCFDSSRSEPIERRRVAPFVAWALTLQLPIKGSPVRPLVAFGNVIEPGHLGAVLFTAETGVAWQAW